MGLKSTEQVARLATNFQVIDYPDATSVDVDSVERAIKVIGYYLNEQLRLSGNSKVKDVSRVLDWLVKKLKDTNESWIVAYKIQQLIHNDLRDSQRIEFALVVLEEKGFIKQINLGNKNYVFVNPHCLVNP